MNNGKKAARPVLTPGTWKVGADLEDRTTVTTVIIDSDDDTIIATIYESQNTALICAAPEMADALIEICETCETSACGKCSVGRALLMAGIAQPNMLKGKLDISTYIDEI